jgi:uncharacterized iron-regulated membrane protein
MRSLRRLLFWSHLFVGVLAGVVIITMSVTGVLLTYQRQMTSWSDRGYRVPVGASRASTGELLRAISVAVPDAAPASLTFRSDPTAPASASLGQGRVLYVDPYTARVLGEGAPGMRAFFRKVTDLHRWLAMKDASRATARKVTGAANLAFLFLITTGAFLWLPRRWTWTTIRAVMLPRRGLSGKARDFNWHHVFGLWFAIPLFIVVASGVVISYPWASALVYRALGENPPASAPRAAPAERAADGSIGAEAKERPPALAGLDGSFDALFAGAATNAPGWRSATVTLPIKNTEKVAFAFDAGDGGQPQLRSTITMNGATGALSKTERFEDGTKGRRARSLLRFAHTGEVLGIPGQTIAGLASLAAAVLVWTGLALSFRRLGARVRREQRATRFDSGFVPS